MEAGRQILQDSDHLQSGNQPPSKLMQVSVNYYVSTMSFLKTFNFLIKPKARLAAVHRTWAKGMGRSQIRMKMCRVLVVSSEHLQRFFAQNFFFFEILRPGAQALKVISQSCCRKCSIYLKRMDHWF